MKESEKVRLEELAEACEECARRCDSNMLLKGTWVQQSFEGLGQRLLELTESPKRS